MTEQLVITGFAVSVVSAFAMALGAVWSKRYFWEETVWAKLAITLVIAGIVFAVGAGLIGEFSK